MFWNFEYLGGKKKVGFDYPPSSFLLIQYMSRLIWSILKNLESGWFRVVAQVYIYIFLISVSFNGLLALLSLTASGISYLDEKVTQTKKSEDAE